MHKREKGAEAPVHTPYDHDMYAIRYCWFCWIHQRRDTRCNQGHATSHDGGQRHRRFWAMLHGRITTRDGTLQSAGMMCTDSSTRHTFKSHEQETGNVGHRGAVGTPPM